MKKLCIATRQSELALKQTAIVEALLKKTQPDLQVEIIGLTTEGDKKLDVSLAKVGGKGLFIKELEQALIEKKADIAVHSMKDVPVGVPAGLIIPVILQREDPRDVLVSNHYSLVNLPQGAVVGTSSFRRQCQLKVIRPDIEIKLLRGNVQTRIRKLDEGQFDAIILAAAGLHRLNLHERITRYLSIKDFVPAVGQGAIGIECREEDNDTQFLIDVLMDEPTALCVQAERLISERLQASCHTPLGVYARIEDNQFKMQAFIANPVSNDHLRCELTGTLARAMEVASELVEALISMGAKKLLEGY